MFWGVTHQQTLSSQRELNIEGVGFRKFLITYTTYTRLLFFQTLKIYNQVSADPYRYCRDNSTHLIVHRLCYDLSPPQ